MGGYHLADADPLQIEQTVKDLKALDPQIMLPGHCSGWKVKYQIEREMPGRLAPSTVGTKFSFV
jgi:7,8-dihydropterin-6-yl-methyl-4-(beta-D-ribofuranosyl)aminobenzene 5'-phosphate synthase